MLKKNAFEAKVFLLCIHVCDFIYNLLSEQSSAQWVPDLETCVVPGLAMPGLKLST